jgi:hypothetical protein
MSLTVCHECKRDVSTEAKKCPGCGAKIRAPKKPMSSTTKLLLSILALAFCASISIQSQKTKEAVLAENRRVTSMSPQQREKEKNDKIKRDYQLKLAGAGALSLRNSMKDPEAFELKSVVVKPNGIACYDYRSKNSFGAILPSSAVMTSHGKIFTPEKNNKAFVSYWNRECTNADGDEITDTVKAVLVGVH